MTRPRFEERSAAGGRSWLPSAHGLLLASVVFVLLVSVPASGALIAPTAATIDSQVDQFESNDGFDQATVLELPFEYANLRASTADTDYYAVSLTRGDRLDVAIDFTHADGDLDLFVHDPNRDVVAASHSVTDGERVSLQAGLGGTYYVSVTSWNDTATRYALSGEKSDGDFVTIDASGYNDGFSSATAITAPFDRAELQISGQDVDVYAVDVDAGRQITVTSRFEDEQADIDLELYDPDRNVLATSATTTDNESLAARATDAGTYYVRVTSETDNTAFYSLRVADGKSSSSTVTPAGTTTPIDDLSSTETETADESTDTSSPTETVTVSEPTDDASTATSTATDTDEATTSEQAQTSTAPEESTPQPTVAVGPGFGIWAVVAAVSLLVLGRRR